MMTKYKAARIAAAEFSGDAQSAANRYANLTGQEFNNWKDALEEIKDILRDCPYRWPTFDSIGEIMIFFNPAGKFTADITIINETPSMQNAKERKDSETYSELGQGQLSIIKARREAYRRAEAEAYLKHAERAYKNTGGDSKKRNSAVSRSLGLSTGKRPKDIDTSQMYKDYFQLVRKDGLCRFDALEIIAGKYNLPSTTAAQQHLSIKLSAIRKAAESTVKKNDAGETTNSFARDVILAYLKGFVLDGWKLEKILDPEATLGLIESLTEKSLPL